MERYMNFIDELITRPDLIKDPENLKSIGKKITVFERVAYEIAHGELGRQIDATRTRQYQVWAKMANQIVGAENF